MYLGYRARLYLASSHNYNTNIIIAKVCSFECLSVNHSEIAERILMVFGVQAEYFLSDGMSA